MIWKYLRCGCNEIEKRFEFRKRTIKWTLKVLKLNIKESHNYLLRTILSYKLSDRYEP